MKRHYHFYILWSDGILSVPFNSLHAANAAAQQAIFDGTRKTFRIHKLDATETCKADAYRQAQVTCQSNLTDQKEIGK